MDSNLSLFHFVISNLHSIPLQLDLLTHGVFIGYLLYKNSLKLPFYMGLCYKNKANWKNNFI
jgi:hypothetical protein